MKNWTIKSYFCCTSNNKNCISIVYFFIPQLHNRNTILLCNFSLLLDNTMKSRLCCVIWRWNQITQWNYDFIVLSRGDEKLHNWLMFSSCNSRRKKMHNNNTILLCIPLLPLNCIIEIWFHCLIFQGKVLEYGWNALTWVVSLTKVVVSIAISSSFYYLLV